VQVVRNNLRGLKIVTVVEKSFTWKTLACACGEGATPSKNRTTGERLLCVISKIF